MPAAAKEEIFKGKKATVNGVTDQIMREISQDSCKQEGNSQQKQHVLFCTLGIDCVLAVCGRFIFLQGNGSKFEGGHWSLSPFGSGGVFLKLSRSFFVLVASASVAFCARWPCFKYCADSCKI